MPGGHASHKGTSAKPNVNASGLTNAADNATENPQEVVGNRTDSSTRADEAMVNPAAIERPQESDEQE